MITGERAEQLTQLLNECIRSGEAQSQLVKTLLPEVRDMHILLLQHMVNHHGVKELRPLLEACVLKRMEETWQ